jgi:uncharacterized protein YqgC (DUF456 family)
MHYKQNAGLKSQLTPVLSFLGAIRTMETLVLIIAVMLLLVGLVVGWGLTVVGMPGNWLIVLLTAGFAWFIPSGERVDVGVSTVVILLILASLGEILEFAAGAWGARRAGGSKRAAVLSLVGSLVGGVLGLIVGFPFPPIGPVVGIILLAAAGATVGALIGERWSGQDWSEGWQVGKAAFAGRLWGTLAKLTVGAVMVVTVLAALLLP